MSARDSLKMILALAILILAATPVQPQRCGDALRLYLRVLNVPGDAGHILLEGISFRKGLYEVDLGGRPLPHAEQYQGEGSKAADEIPWVVRDSSLRRPSRQKRQTIEQLAKTLADAYAAKAMGKLDARRPYLRGVRIVIEDSLDEDHRQARRVKTLMEAERWLRGLEREDGTPFREARLLVRCGQGRCTYNLDGGIDHNHLYLERITYGYRNRAPYIKAIFLLDGD